MFFLDVFAKKKAKKGEIGYSELRFLPYFCKDFR